ncbi:formylmethanofuran dehydrogenase subunit C [Methanoregula sp. PtaB.Bin085]|uniref:formylmethanofuran dehydrogenase subunit C n=1 Tax=Methanoregula sp. PtaB.Bin085 TaxID=1811680 RepID=UPI0009C96713|nr:formylmethanofuran dehydrogenase subunit C [Methanoregula sp. PtaB.Bin085]OPX62318.1 MAG: Tungsten-containing formylmethanofuran dehydrogenase 2 subunit C [Methanoregula sp. PtaB.Bin085]
MATIILTPKKTPELMLEGYNITPDSFAGKTPAQIAGLEGREGKIKVTLGDFFTVSGNSGATAAETDIVIAGDCSRVKYIGNKMTAGSITVNGNADMYVGGWMKGGTIHVTGNVHSFCGIAMEGGEILVDGNAENYVGCAYRGDWRGMRGGTIRIRGNAGNDIGTFMLGGTIIVEKNAFIHVSTHAEGGTVIIRGDVEGRVGGQMVKGDIFVLGKIKYMLPGFRKVGTEEKQVDGTKARFNHYIGDLGERHPKSKGQEIYANLYVRAAA